MSINLTCTTICVVVLTLVRCLSCSANKFINRIRAFYLYSSFAGIRVSVENGSVRALSLFE